MTGQQVHGHTQEVAHMTVSEVAKELHLDRTRVLRLINSGDLPATNIAPIGATRNTWRIDEEDLKRWMASRRNARGPEKQ